MSFPISFWGSPNISASFLDRLHRDKRFSVQYVVTQTDKARSKRGRQNIATPVKSLAQKMELPCFEPIDLKETSFRRKIESVKIYLHLVLAYGKIIPEDIFSRPELGSVNFHASLLPKLRGASPIETALWEGHSETGWSLQKIRKKLDSGEIISQTHINMDWEDNQESLYAKMSKKLLSQGVEMLYSYTRYPEKLTPQNEAEATFCTKINKPQGQIDWNESLLSIRNKARALEEKPGVFTFWSGNRIRLFIDLQTPLETLNRKRHEQAAGSIVTSGNKLYVVCGDGYIIDIKKVQLSGKGSIQAEDFINGYLSSMNHKIYTFTNV